MPRADTLALITRYYAAFNAGDPAAMLACLTDDIEHRVNEGAHRIGKDRFAEFCGHMGGRCRCRWSGSRQPRCATTRHGLVIRTVICMCRSTPACGLRANGVVCIRSGFGT